VSMWHACLGHLNFQVLKKMVSQDSVQGLPKIDLAGYL
jgi:hypothetical protein